MEQGREIVDVRDVYLDHRNGGQWRSFDRAVGSLNDEGVFPNGLSIEASTDGDDTRLGIDHKVRSVRQNGVVNASVETL